MRECGYQCTCGPDAPLLPLRDPWYPGNGYSEKESGANVWCASCGDAWKVDDKRLAEVTAEAKRYDRESENRDEARKTREQLEAWEAWCSRLERARP